MLGRRFGAGIERAVTRYLRAVYARSIWCWRPAALMCSYLARLGCRAQRATSRWAWTPRCSRRRGARSICAACCELPDDARLLVFAGRFSEEKNLHVLRDAMALLGKPYHLLLIGGGRAARPSHNVSVLPYRRDSIELAQWLASADALVHAGSSETFGLVIIEAMACGRPVVGVRAGAVPELIDERVGELAEPESAASMAQAIRRLVRARPGRAGRQRRAQRVLQRFTWSHVLQLQLASYASVFGRRAMPAHASRDAAGPPRPNSVAASARRHRYGVQS